MPRFPYVQWYPADYLSERKTARLGLDEHGAYHLLLWCMWQESDEQCVFPLDYAALGGIWRVCPEEAERILDSLMAPGMALLKVVKRRGTSCLFSKRLDEEAKRARQKSARQSDAGKRSGVVRREKSLNHSSTTVQPLLNLSEADIEADIEEKEQGQRAYARKVPPPCLSSHLKDIDTGIEGTGYEVACSLLERRLSRPLAPTDLAMLDSLLFGECLQGCPRDEVQQARCIAAIRKAIEKAWGRPLAVRIMREDRV
jgi:uncharacterized protein YdaU (DUF1376 family)